MLQLRPEVEELNRLYQAMDETYHAVAARAGLSDSAFLIFYALAELGDGCTQQEIARRYYASKQTIHSSIKVLEQKGYLTRTAGRQVLEEKLTPVFRQENQAVEAMDSQELETLLVLLRKYVRLHQQLLGEGVGL